VYPSSIAGNALTDDGERREGRTAAADDRWNDVASANQHFHRALVALAGSAWLDHQMALLRAEMRLVFHGVSGVREFHEPYLERIDGICTLLEAGERAAEPLTRCSAGPPRCR
jgi:DNA-binding GntR family transcriptional regulator